MENNNKLTTTRANLNLKDMTKEQQLVVPFYDTYVAMYPNVDTTTAFRVAMNFAYALSNVKNKAGQFAIDFCDVSSVRMAFDEVIKYGLDLTLQQAVMIPYGNKLQLQIEYFGWQKILKDLYPNCEINAVVVYDGEPFEIDRLPNGKFNFKHRPNAIARRKGVINGAYFECRVKTLRNKTTKTTYPDGRIEENTYSYYDYEIIGTDYMTFDEIKKSWEKSKNGIAVHTAHPHEMAKKTIINRGCKALVRTMQAFNSDVIYDEEEPKGIVIETPLEYTVVGDNSSEEFNKEKEEVLEKIRQHEKENNVINTDNETTIYKGETIVNEDGMVYYDGCIVEEQKPIEDIYGNNNIYEYENQEQQQTNEWFDLPYRQYKENENLYEKDINYNENGFKKGYNATTRTIRVRKK